MRRFWGINCTVFIIYLNMRKFFVCLSLLAAMSLPAQQLTNANFEDWSGAAFDGNPQPKGWNASNVTQFGFNFNFAHRETGHNGGYCMMVQDQDVGAVGITETSPGYFALGQPWVYIASLTAVSEATAGTAGGITWAYRPDTMSVWIKRTGNNTDKEDFYLLYYSWNGQTRADKYKGKNGNCASVTKYDEESDVRQDMNGNECGTAVKATQVAEGMWRERKTYGDWINMRVPIYYMNSVVPTTMNIIFSASNYPNARSNSGLYAGNSLYVDDVELIYSSKIHKLYIDDKEWKGFDPNTTEVQTYSLGESATSIPKIEARRGMGSLTNASGKTVNFAGRVLSGSEITITNGDLTNKPTTITVKSEDGKSSTTYNIQFVKAASSNAKLAAITVNGTPVEGFSPTKYTYNVALPYGTTAAPVVAVEKQEDAQTVTITQASSVTGAAAIRVTAANGSATQTYTLNFSVAALADNTLVDIQVNGKSVPGFTPNQTTYKVSLPVGTAKVPEVKGISAYPAGAQTIEYTLPTLANLDGGSALIKVTTPGNQTPKTYKLNFKLEASSYSLLKMIYIGGTPLTDFAPEQYTYYRNLPMGTETLPAITWDKGDEYQTVTLAEGGLDGTTRITVTAGNGDQTVYKLIFSTAKSEISTLQGITIGGVALEGFRPDQTTYEYKLPIGTTELPAIVPINGDEYQKVSINTGGVNGSTRITVTAGNGSTTIYIINFSVDSYTDNTLGMIYIAGTPLEGFSPEKNEYYYNLEKGTSQLPEISFDKKDENLQTVTIRSGGVNGDYRITVRPQSGASRTYIIHFSVATSSNTALAMIKLDGVELDSFHPDTTHYTVIMPEGVSAVPNVSYVKAEPTQRVLSVLEDTTQTLTVTAESGAKRTYQLDFRFQLSANALLEMIYLDSIPLEGFEPEQVNYIFQLKSSECPAVTVGKALGQQVSITTPVGAGKAVILVAPEQGPTNTYTITFLPKEAASVQLQSILLDGTPLATFDPAKGHYEAAYAGELPAITWTGAEGKEVNLLWVAQTAYIHVRDLATGAKAVYDIVFTRQYANDALLASILADGVQLPDFAKEKKQYLYNLAAGSTYPTLSYEKSAENQVVTAGQTAEGEWTFAVTAENGDQAKYTVRYTIAQFTDSTLQNVELEGLPASETFTFNPAVFEYDGLKLDEGAALPDVKVTAKPRQKVLCFNASANEQQILVTAENGAQAKYTIRYTRSQSSNALLANILIDGVALVGFAPETHDYAVTLPQGTQLTPNVFPVGQLDNQTITTYLSRPNGVTHIHVVAQDGTEADYTIAFQVQKCTNTKLKSLTIDGISRDVNVTEYNFELPYGSKDPYDVAFEKAEAEQLIEYIEAPVSGVTRIIVTDENHDSRTYSIRYTVAEPQGENKIPRVVYQYVNASSATVTDSITPVAGENVIELPYGAKSFEVTRVDKNYDEQSVIFYNGGIRRGATIIASANRNGAEDVTYTLVPHMPEYDTAGKLSDLKFKGTTIPNFRPDVYNYMINVTAQPTAAYFTATAFGGKTVQKSSIDNKKKQITLTVSGGEKYSVCWYYSNDKDPFDLSDPWIAAAKGTGMKPANGWKVMADYSEGYNFSLVGYNIPYTTGKEAAPYGDNGVMLSTLRQGALRGSIPGMMSLGEMAFTPNENGNSSSSVTCNATAGKQFRNTPEELVFEYTALRANDINAWSIWLTMSDGTNYQKTTFNGNYNTTGVKTTASMQIGYPTSSSPTRVINATLNSCGTENAKDMNGFSANQSADLVLQNMHLAYNSELTAATIDGVAATKTGNTFTRNVGADYVGVPALKFTGKVHDQMQKIEWLDNGEWVNGELKARVTNYGENSIDSTVYTVVLKRAAVTSLDYEISFGTYTTTALDDTVFVAMPYGTKRLPDMQITPFSIHQRFAFVKSGNTVKVTVTAENAGSKTTIYVFREEKAADATLESLSLASGVLETVDAEALRYRVVATQMPVVEFDKKSVGQTIDLRYTTDSATIAVTAEDGVTQHTYHIARVEPTVVTTGKIAEFEINGNILTELGGNTYSCEKERPAGVILYTREYVQDSIVFIQTPADMVWQVYGGENHTYTYSYPTAQSANNQLASIRVNGKELEDFDPSVTDYVVPTDSAFVQLVAAEAAQTLTVAETTDESGSVFAIQVAAEDATAPKKAYKLTLSHPKSDDRSLAGIYADGVLIAGFRPDSLKYTVVLPAPAIKKELPQMPSITYTAGHLGQTIELTQGQIGEDNPTTLRVLSEQGHEQEYTVTVVAEPSHCADITGILVNGTALEGFEPGRHYYSIEVETDEVEIGVSSDDRFQTIKIDRVGSDSIIHVMAEDSVTVNDYHVNVYAKLLSNDATLSSILLDGKDFMLYRRDLNPLLEFKPMQNTYTINLPSGATTLPEITARLKMDGQQVAISKHGMVVTITVTAVDGTPNDYTLSFETPKSRDANLSMIFLNGDSLEGFTPDYYFYQVNLPVGVHELPEVVGQKGESHQTILPVEIDNDRLQAAISVKPEDPYANPSTYVIAFHYTQSAADTLKMLYADGDSLRNFAPHTFFYTDSLPVGTTAFPELSWEEADEWQTIRMDTVVSDSINLIRQVFVTAENGQSNTYTVSYAIRKSDVDTLQAVFVDTKALEGFSAHTEEYYYQLTAAEATALDGALPTVEFIKGDEYQTVMVSQAQDSLSGKSLGYKSLISVTAATGSMRIYTIHYPVERSSDANLNMIMLGGKPLSGFDSERYTYRPEIEGRDNLPVVSVIKKEEAQTYEIFVNQDTVRIEVTAEDGSAQTYTLAFERLLSSNTQLANIEIAGHREFRFDPDEYDYTIVLPYGEDTIPAFEVILQDTLQTIPSPLPCDTLANGDILYTIVVTAANGDEGNPYTLTFSFTKNNDARLLAIYVDSILIEGFDAAITEYEIVHPYGTDSASFYGIESVGFILSDSLAECQLSQDEQGTIFVRVVAQDGKTENTYTIRQTISPDTDNALAAILLDGDTLSGFDADQTFYTYLLMEGANPPVVDAIARSENAEISILEASAGDTCLIICTAADGSDRRYYLYFAVSQINDAQKPTSNDVLLKRLPGEPNLFVATLRKDVSFALYDQYGHLVYYEKVPVANPNDVDVSDDPSTKERLNDVTNTASGLVVPLIPGQIYQYGFYVSDKEILKTGKFIAY